MNKVMLCGRLTRDPEVRYSQNGSETKSVARFSLAVDRRGSNDVADFISCISFGKSAEFAEKYLRKGTKIIAIGRIQTGSYTNKDGQKVYTTDVVVDEFEFAESKKEAAGTNGDVPKQAVNSEGFMSIPDGIDEELPFN